MAEPFLGEIRLFAGSFAPYQWALCNGQILPIPQYAALFSLLGTYYGGNGQTNFALPNLQGMAVMHQGQGIGLSTYIIGETVGTAAVTILSPEIPFHTHAFTNPNVSFSLPAGTSAPTSNQPGPTAAFAPAHDLRGAAINTYIPAANATNKVSLTAVSLVNKTTQQPPATTDNAGGSQPHNNMQPYLVLNYIIALAGVFPSRN